MRANLIRQYEGIRDNIVRNVDTIKGMVKQAEDLSELAESLSDTDCAEIKKKLQEQIGKLHQSISQLVDQTTELFKLYNQFADQLFS